MNLYKEIKYRLQSMSGLVPWKSYPGESSIFDVLLEAAAFKVASSTSNINIFVDDIINEFMIGHHKLLVSQLHFRWD